MSLSNPELPQGGFCVWMTGLSGAGKSTLATLVAERVACLGVAVDVLDGDAVRAHLSPRLGFSKADRDENVLRIGWVASRLVRANSVVLVAAISPYRSVRAQARARVEAHGSFLEAFIDAPLELCSSRDPKGLYAKECAGQIENLTGIDDPYEQPLNPEIHIDTARLTPTDAADRLLIAVSAFGLLSRGVRTAG